MNYQPSNYLPYNFAHRRHIGPSPQEMEQMLELIGVGSIDELIEQTIPASIRRATPMKTVPPLSEGDALLALRDLAGKNKAMQSLIGQGYYGTITPPAIARNILENPAWYTAYTPYQPEISQGRLEALLNFQTMVADLTGLPIANASLLDEATAAAEAMTMAQRVARSKQTQFFVDAECHPQTIDVIRTRAAPLGIEVKVGDPLTELKAGEVFAAIFQYPSTRGSIRDFSSAIAELHSASALAIMAADIMALLLLKEPSQFGADIAIGSTQRFGVPLGFGGPHAAYIATRTDYARALPGRLVGVSRDTHGKSAYRLALQTREQHIRRERATSNVCTAQALLAVMASMYAVFHGPSGLRAIAERIHRGAATLARRLEALGFAIEPQHFFDTFCVRVGPLQGVILNAAEARGVNLRRIGDDTIGISVDEQTLPATLDAVVESFGGSPAQSVAAGFDADYDFARLPAAHIRTSNYLTHPVFHMNRAEAEMTRYMRRLADRDLALDRAMIPLGSCTMKLNATAEMIPITWREFAEVHPFAPARQVRGYMEVIEQLSSWLCEITGFDAVSMQPNSGAQGEYAGLLTIRRYHQARGQAQRDVCLIPTSAHGTNPASAQVAGMKVVAVNSLRNGDIDVADLRSKAEQYSQRLAACMITYPSTHGVFEQSVREVCDIAHEFGAQVYIDGANMNAMVGLVEPGKFGGDVCHLNLHKTFCIPHGGGGPGMGPIAVKSHLAPYLPSHRYHGDGSGAVSAAAYGSPSLLPISLSYCWMMGSEGLTQASRVAILSANYIAKRLENDYQVLYSGANGRVAHECIIDTRALKETAGITVDDIAKRLIDCGFHAPTMSWPVIGTMMIEPTESEPKAELDRFCDAMLGIKAEADAIAAGKIDRENNPLRRAPHTVEDLVGEWNRPYARKQACYPRGAFRTDKYWAPVGRIDNVYGDRNLVCTCPSVEEASHQENNG